MSLPDDLLQEAQELAAKGKTKPKQASLRRAVSTAYYALFHRLVEDAGATQVRNKRLRPVFQRAFQHAVMVDASKSFEGGNLPDHLKDTMTAPVSTPLRTVAKAFVRLQQARHEADYDASRRFSLGEVQALLTQADNAFRLWQGKVPKAERELFLASLLLWKQWRR